MSPAIPLRRALPILLLLLAACSGLAGEPDIIATVPPRTAPPPEPSFPAQPPDIAAGAQIFAESCTRCHGAGGAGDGELVRTGQVGDPRNFTLPDFARVQTPQQWFNTITNGRLELLMPPWGDSLSAAQRWDVALYTYTLHYTPEQITRGEQIWTAGCGDACDSLAGIGPLADLEVMAAVSDAQLRAALPASISAEDDAWAAVAYLRTRALQNAGLIGQQIIPSEATQETQSVEVPPVVQTQEVVSGEAGAVVGQVSNGTAGGDSPAGLNVRLFRWDSSFNPLEPISTTVSADGNFSFDGIEIDPTFSYAVAVDYRDNRFISDFLRGTANPLALPVTIYEPTEDPSVISIVGIVNQMTAVGNGVQVVQVINFQNNSDRFYTTSDEVVDGRAASVIISLPPGSAVLGFPSDEQRFIVSEDQTTVVDTLPVLPNQDHIVQLVYLVPYEGDAIIEQPLNYPLDGQVRLLLRPDTLEVISEQLAPIGAQVVGENTYKGYGGTLQLGASDALSFELRGAPAPAAAQLEQPQVVTSNNLLLIGGLVLVVLGAVIGGLYFVYRGRGTQAISKRDEKLIDALARQIAELDEAHEKGEINHDLYRRQRKQLKDRLAEIMGVDDE